MFITQWKYVEVRKAFCEMSSSLQLYVDSGDQTQVTSLVRQTPYPLSHLACPSYV